MDFLFVGVVKIVGLVKTVRNCAYKYCSRPFFQAISFWVVYFDAKILIDSVENLSEMSYSRPRAQIIWKILVA